MTRVFRTAAPLILALTAASAGAADAPAQAVDSKAAAVAPEGGPPAVSVPKVVASLEPGSRSYSAKMEGGGRSSSISITETIKEEGGNWVVSTNAQFPNGEASDATVLDKATYVLRKRSLKQGPGSIELTFEGGKVTGTMTSPTGPKPISADLGGELFADGAGGPDVLALLPLAESYATRFRTFDLRTQKAGMKELKVLGTEDVTVPAGSAKAWKARITSADGEPGETTLWIAMDSRKVLKSLTVVPEMGGATVTLELQP